MTACRNCANEAIDFGLCGRCACAVLRKVKAQLEELRKAVHGAESRGYMRAIRRMARRASERKKARISETLAQAIFRQGKAAGRRK